MKKEVIIIIIIIYCLPPTFWVFTGVSRNIALAFCLLPMAAYNYNHKTVEYVFILINDMGRGCRLGEVQENGLLTVSQLLTCFCSLCVSLQRHLLDHTTIAILRSLLIEEFRTNSPLRCRSNRGHKGPRLFS